MKESTKQEKYNQKLAELFSLTIEEVKQKRRDHQNDGHAREAQAIFLFIERPDAFIKKKCDNCHQVFLTTYQFVSVCSTECRIESLEKIGIDWNPLHTADEVWKRAQIPTEYSIPPKALKILIEIAKSQDYSNPTEVSEISPEESSEKTSEPPSEPVHTVPQQINGSHKSPNSSPPLSESILAEVEKELADLGLL